MRILVAIIAPLAFGIIWFLIQRAALKYPNNGNEFSQDNGQE
jgi:hypothetical protein